MADQDQKIDYRAEGLLFLKLKESGEKVTQIKFCEKRSAELGKTVSLGYFKKILRGLKVKKKKSSANVTKKEIKGPFPSGDGDSIPHHDWAALKTEFMKGEHKSLSALARSFGINPGSYQFRKKTEGWLKERLAISKKISEKTIQILTESQAADKARNMYAEILAFQWRIMDALKVAANSVPDWKKIDSPYTAGAVAEFALTMQTVFEKIMPNIKSLEKMADMDRIFKGLSNGSMNIEQAAIKFVKLGVQMPEPLKIMLQKHQPEETLPDDSEEISETEILDRRQKMLQEIQVERTDFVAERRREVKQLKAEMAHVESFTEESDGPED